MEGSCLLLLPHAGCPIPLPYTHLLFCHQQVTLIHSKIALADVELLQSVRQEVKEILLRKGVRLLLSMYLTMPLKTDSDAPQAALPLATAPLFDDLFPIYLIFWD